MDITKVLKYLLALLLALIIVSFVCRVFVGAYAYQKTQHDAKQAIERFHSLNK